jgi:azurin
MKNRYAAVLVLCFFVLVGGYGIQAQSEPQEVIIKPVGNLAAFDLEEITATAGSRLKLVFDNTATNPGMRHNVVLLNVGPEDEDTIVEIGIAAISAPREQDFIPDSDVILAFTSMVAAGERAEVVFTVPPPGDYSYICTYLGHYMTMRGVLHSVN